MNLLDHFISELSADCSCHVDNGVTGTQVAVGTGEFEDLKCG
jgi:hypothetical protein